MGTSFFKGKGSPITGGNQNMEARAIGAGQYGARGAGIGAQKTLSDAKIKLGGKPLKRSAAYPKGLVT